MPVSAPHDSCIPRRQVLNVTGQDFDVFHSCYLNTTRHWTPDEFVARHTDTPYWFIERDFWCLDRKMIRQSTVKVITKEDCTLTRLTKGIISPNRAPSQ